MTLHSIEQARDVRSSIVKRTSQLRAPKSENDPTRTFDLIIVCVAGWDICHSTDVRGCELGTRLRMRL